MIRCKIDDGVCWEIDGEIGSGDKDLLHVHTFVSLSVPVLHWKYMHSRNLESCRARAFIAFSLHVIVKYASAANFDKTTISWTQQSIKLTDRRFSFSLSHGCRHGKNHTTFMIFEIQQMYV